MAFSHLPCSSLPQELPHCDRQLTLFDRTDQPFVEYFRIPQANHEYVNEKLVGLSKMKWHDPCCQLLPLHYLRVLLSWTTSYSSCDQRACALLSHPHVA